MVLYGFIGILVMWVQNLRGNTHIAAYISRITVSWTGCRVLLRIMASTIFNVKRKVSIFEEHDSTTVCSRRSYHTPVMVFHNGEEHDFTLVDVKKEEEVFDNETISLQSASADSTIPDEVQIIQSLYDEVSYYTNVFD